MQIETGRRIVWLSALAMLVLIGLAVRLYQIQIVDGPRYARRAYQQRTLTLPVAEVRGRILDRSGQPLTGLTREWRVGLFPPLVQEPDRVAGALATALNLPPAQISAALEAEPPRAVWLDAPITEATARRIASLGLDGVSVGPIFIRYGPGALARHLIGYVNEADGRLTGQMGLERAFDDELYGEAVPAMVAHVDGLGNPLAGLEIRTMKPLDGKEPYHLHTTIDARIQAIVEAVLDERRPPYAGPLRGAVVVMEPRTGEVLAMASRPQLPVDDSRLHQVAGGCADLIASARAKSRDNPCAGLPLLNRAVLAYPPGSVFKPIIAAEALEAGLVTLDERFTCTGSIQIGPTTFTDATPNGHGDLTFREAVAQSCNVTFLHLGHERMGDALLRRAALRFGFGTAPDGLGEERTLPEGEEGTVPAKGDPSLLQIAFGQGSLEVTPLQVARAYSAIANGGVLPPVRLVTALKSPTGEVMAKPAAGRPKRILSRETARDLQKALIAVTDPRGSGTGKRAWIAEGGAAGKTGSAEGVSADGTREAVHAWFAGYLPAAAPRYVIVVFIEDGRQGGAVAAPIFREIGRRILAAAAATPAY